MCAGARLKPTKEPVYLRKKSTTLRAKVVRSATATPVIVRTDSSDSASEGSGQYDYVIRAKSSHNKQKSKHADCGCGGRCGKASGGARNLGPDKARIIVRSDSGKRCNCNGSGNDGWLCDSCRAAQKKKGVWKLLSCASDSNTGSCCCGGCGNAKARFEKEVDTWMKESKEKMKKARNGKVVCHCHRPGCKVCVFVKY